MELKNAGQWLKDFLKKDKARRLLVVLGLCGIALLALSSWSPPEEKPQAQPESGTQTPADYAGQLEKDLARVVTAITGEKEPVVMVTLENTGRHVYAADRKESAQSGAEGAYSREEESAHVLLEDREGAQKALPVTQMQPKVQGAVIVTRYAADPVVREKLINAAKTALGISAARVCVTD